MSTLSASFYLIPLRYFLALLSVYRWENGGPEWLKHLPKVKILAELRLKLDFSDTEIDSLNTAMLQSKGRRCFHNKRDTGKMLEQFRGGIILARRIEKALGSSGHVGFRCLKIGRHLREDCCVQGCRREREGHSEEGPA